MRRFWLIALAAVAGGLVTAVGVVAALLLAYSGVPDRDGGRSMGIIFMIGPFTAMIGGVVSAVIAAKRLARGAGAEVTAARPLQRSILLWAFGTLATVALGIAGVNFMTAGGVLDGLYALGFAAAFAGAAWYATRA